MNILIPVLQQYANKNIEKSYYSFIAKEIVSSQDTAVVLEINKLDEYRKLFQHNSVTFLPFNESDIPNIIKDHNINYFFSHASFAPPVLKLRNLLLTEPFYSDVTCIWHEGGFLRDVCRQFDWYGWNALSSLAHIGTFPDITENESKFVNHFMNEIFLPQKIKSSLSRNYVKNEFKITQDHVSLIALQVYNDSVLKHFAGPNFNGYEWILNFTNKHRDTFFVIKDHPKQRNVWTYGSKGLNWVYLDKDYKTSTMDFVFAIDSVVTVNSTVGMEFLYWKPVYLAGKSAYSKLCKSIDDFSNHFERDINLLNKFFHYAIIKFHYTNGYNANSLREWFEKLPILKSENRHLLQNPALHCS